MHSLWWCYLLARPSTVRNNNLSSVKSIQVGDADDWLICSDYRLLTDCIIATFAASPVIIWTATGHNKLYTINSMHTNKHVTHLTHVPVLTHAVRLLSNIWIFYYLYCVQSQFISDDNVTIHINSALYW